MALGGGIDMIARGDNIDKYCNRWIIYLEPINNNSKTAKAFRCRQSLFYVMQWIVVTNHLRKI